MFYFLVLLALYLSTVFSNLSKIRSGIISRSIAVTYNVEKKAHSLVLVITVHCIV